jgi:hypothetical protein
VTTFEDFHLLATVATALDHLGWSAEDTAMRDTAPTAARGHNLVAVTPPAPVYATPAVAGALSRVGDGKRMLLLCPPAQLDEWGQLVHGLAEGSTIRSHVAAGTARAMRLIRAGEVDVLISSLSIASTLVIRSALSMDTVGSLLVAWPESWTDEEGLIPLMQDLPKEAQRIIYTADRNRVNALTERYARKALTVQMASVPTAPSPARTVSAAWEGRLRAVTDLIELLDPVSLAIWTLDRSHHRAIAERISLRESVAQLVTRGPVTAQTIIAFDLPTGERLRELAEGGEVVLLVPPGAEGYVASIADPRRPIQLPGAVDAALAAEADHRSRIGQAIVAGGLEHSVATLAPLFERHDPVSVAAALFKLWTGSPESSATPARQESTISRIYVGAGKKDGVTPNDLVAVLTKELKVNREKIGRIELRDSFSLIEIPTAEADQVARGLNGTTIRRRRVTARVDRGRTKPGRNSKV